MKIFTLFALVVGIVAVIFASQNAAPVLVRFFGWQAQESMALVLLLTFALGVVSGLLVSVPPMIGRMRKIAQLKRKVDEQAYDLESADRKLTDATNQLTALQAGQLSPQTNVVPHSSILDQPGKQHEY